MDQYRQHLPGRRLQRPDALIMYHWSLNVASTRKGKRKFGLLKVCEVFWQATAKTRSQTIVNVDEEESTLCCFPLGRPRSRKLGLRSHGTRVGVLRFMTRTVRCQCPLPFRVCIGKESHHYSDTTSAQKSSIHNTRRLDPSRLILVTIMMEFVCSHAMASMVEILRELKDPNTALEAECRCP